MRYKKKGVWVIEWGGTKNSMMAMRKEWVAYAVHIEWERARRELKELRETHEDQLFRLKQYEWKGK
jgi:hypothetical protein